MNSLLSPKNTAILFRQLSAAARNGLPWSDVFDALGTDPDLFGKEADVMTRVAGAVAATPRLSDGLALCPEIFSPHTVRLVALAEAKGALPVMLDAIADDGLLAAEGRKSVRDAAVWPSILMGAMVVVLMLVMIFVIPAFKDVYMSFSADLPLPTRMLTYLSDLFVEYWWLLLLIGGAFRQLYIRDRLPARLQRLPESLVVAWPSLRRMVDGVLAARLALWLRICGADRSALSAAVRHVGAGFRLVRCREATQHLADALDAGIQPADALARAPAIPGYFAGLLRLAGKSADPKAALDQLESLAGEANLAAIDRFARSAMLSSYLLIGLILGSTVIGLYLPIFKLGSVM